uniref:Uncharacterized protein n=1 Tax=Anguilla anguilla TaxID=7936 RepID=A0A0E9XVG7_ANGAN
MASCFGFDSFLGDIAGSNSN